MKAKGEKRSSDEVADERYMDAWTARGSGLGGGLGWWRVYGTKRRRRCS